MAQKRVFPVVVHLSLNASCINLEHFSIASATRTHIHQHGDGVPGAYDANDDKLRTVLKNASALDTNNSRRETRPSKVSVGRAASLLLLINLRIKHAQ